jgi:hypothetical protein
MESKRWAMTDERSAFQSINFAAIAIQKESITRGAKQQPATTFTLS